MANLEFQLCLASLLFFFTIQNGHATKNLTGFSFKMIHRHSPESPMYNANLTKIEKLREYIEMSNSRVKSFSRFFSAKNTNDDVIRPVIGFDNSLYHVEVGIGTFDLGPRFRYYYLNFDTGSDITWTQCEGCAPNCFSQRDPLFPSSQSRSYKPFLCLNCPPGGRCQNNVCTVQREYGDGSSVVAIPARETFTLQSVPDNRNVALLDIFFGCGIEMRNFLRGSDPNNKISGILGMGHSEYSFWRQSQSISRGLFSYCLQLPSEARKAGNPPMYLRFGFDSVPLPRMQTTTITQNFNNPLFYLNLQGISVAEQRLAINPSVFQIKQDGSGGCVIDSGSTTSYIVSDAYVTLEDVVTRKIEEYNPSARKMDQVPPELVGLKLCFQGFSSASVDLPTITFHLGNNADFIIQPNSAFFFYTLSSGVRVICLLIQESTQSQLNSITLLGSLQQANYRIIYDPLNGQLLFGPDNCLAAN